MAAKLRKYRELHWDQCLYIHFIPTIVSTSGRIHRECLRLLFVHLHCKTTRYFEILNGEQAQPNTPRFA